MTMGTASTMTALAEVMGMTLAGASSVPATHSGHSRMASMTGRRAVELAWINVKPSEILIRTAFENAITTLMAIGGSTNAIVHLMAMAGRTGVKLTLEDFDQASQRTPVLANLRPTGKYVMADFFDAGGLNALLVQIADLLNLNAQTIAGHRDQDTGNCEVARAAVVCVNSWSDGVPSVVVCRQQNWMIPRFSDRMEATWSVHADFGEWTTLMVFRMDNESWTMRGFLSSTHFSKDSCLQNVGANRLRYHP